MTFEEYTGKKVALTTDCGYIYNRDKSKKTKDIEVAAEWYGCKKEDLVQICTFSYNQTGIYFEPEEGRVKVTNWKINNTRTTEGEVSVIMMDPRINRNREAADGSNERDEEFFPAYYIYPNGFVSHEDVWKEYKTWMPSYPQFQREQAMKSFMDKLIKNRTPHATKKIPITACNGLWYYDYPQNYLVLNEPVVWRGQDFGAQSKKVFREAGIISEKNDYITVKGTQYHLSNPGMLIWWIIAPKGTAKVAKGSEDLMLGETQKLNKGIRIKIEQHPEGTLFRCVTNRESRDENKRILISKKGTIVSTIEGLNESGEKTWVKTSVSFRWFYELCQEIANDNHGTLKDSPAIEGSFKDLLVGNNLFKYSNTFINEHLEELLCIDPAQKDSYKYVENNGGLHGFLRQLVRYPGLIETITKEFPEVMFDEYKVEVLKSTGKKVCYWEKQEHTPDELETIVLHKFNPDFINFFGEISKKAKDGKKLLDTLMINSAQWKFVNERAKEAIARGEDKKEAYKLNWGFLIVAKRYFTGNTDRWGMFRRNEDGDDRFVAKKLSDVPMEMFKELYYTAKEIENDPRFATVKYYNCWGNKYVGNLLLEQYNLLNEVAIDWKIGDIKKDGMIKAIKKCMDKNIELNTVADYLRMRNYCSNMRIEGFNIEDWPMVPSKIEWINVLHDRLVELYNSADLKRRAAEQTENQKKYDAVIKKNKLFNFEYERDDNSRCVVCPKELIEVILEGAKLSHCVGSYCGSIAEGKEVILFLRDKKQKDISYATIDIVYNSDIKKWDVRQIHTRCNGDITEEDKAFIMQWAAEKNVNKETIHTHYGALCHA